jgi:MFS superfamily sulfate permease-like transporter
MSNQIPEREENAVTPAVKDDAGKTEATQNYSWYGFALGLPFIVVYSMVFDNLAIGIIFGIAMGIVFFSAFAQEPIAPTEPTEPNSEDKASTDEVHASEDETEVPTSEPKKPTDPSKGL